MCINKIICGDAQKLITQLSDSSIDLIVTSVPYNSGLEYDSYDDSKDDKEYYQMLKTVFSKAYQKLKSGGRCCINIGDRENGKIPTHVEIVNLMQKMGYLMMTTIVWDKENASNRCLNGDELINTLRGYKLIKEIKEGDYVLTHKRRYKKVIGVHKTLFTGQKYNVELIGAESLNLYGDHPLYVAAVYHRKSRINKRSPKGAPRKRVPPKFMWKKPSELEPLEYYVMVPKYTTQYHATIKAFNKRIEKITGIPLNYYSEEFFRLMGYYLGDGSNHRTEVRFDFGPDENYLVEDIKQICKFFEFSCHSENRPNLNRIVINSKNRLPIILEKLCGKYAHKKELHPFLFQAPFPLQEQLLFGAFHADGHFDHKQNSLRSTSEKLIYQMRDILVRLKMAPIIYKDKKLSVSKLNDGRIIKGHYYSYSLRLTGKFAKKLQGICNIEFNQGKRKYLFNRTKIGSHYAYYRIKNINIEDVKQIEVYNLEVEEDNSYMGKVLYHNCSWGSFKSPKNPSFPTPFEYILVFSKESYALQEAGETDLTNQEFVDWSLAKWLLRKTDYKRCTRLINSGIHKAPFPEEIPRRLIKMLSWKSATVLDPFVGTGTTAIAAKRLGRNYIGFDLSQKNVDYAIKNLQNLMVDTTLFEEE